MFGNMKNDNNPKSVENFTDKMASAIERAYTEKAKKEERAKIASDNLKVEKENNEILPPITPESYWSKKYCAINKDKCAGEHCLFWDKHIPCFDLGTLGNCTFLVASTSILALAGIMGDMINSVKGE